MEAEDFIDLQRIDVSEVGKEGKEVLSKEEGEMVEDHVEKKDDQLPLESSVSNGADLEKHLSENGPESALEPVALESKVEVDLFAVGTKRRRISYSSQQPSVRVVYSLLTRESKNKLGELMQQWSDWHSRNASTRKDSTEESLESGEETYFPALCVGLEKSSTVTFWMDNQARLDGKIGNSSEIESVPMYDRGFTKGSSSGEGLASLERCTESPEHDSRCFNCGSYNHSLKECPKPRDNVAVNNARKKHNSKRKTPLGPRLPTRYYQNSPGGKFDGIKPGVIGSETRQCLGIGVIQNLLCACVSYAFEPAFCLPMPLCIVCTNLWFAVGMKSNCFDISTSSIVSNIVTNVSNIFKISLYYCKHFEKFMAMFLKILPISIATENNMVMKISSQDFVKNIFRYILDVI